MKRILVMPFSESVYVRSTVPKRWEPAVTAETRAHEHQADANTPRTRAATIWRIEHRDDYANTIY